jgi:hypothetical protein
MFGISAELPEVDALWQGACGPGLPADVIAVEARYRGGWRLLQNGLTAC